MNMCLKSILQRMEDYPKKRFDNLIRLSNGYCLGNQETREFVKWCVANGYETLHDVPESAESEWIEKTGGVK